jgi:ABC-type lipoprotein release transport system permease subunit
MALGAKPQMVARLIVMDGMRLVLIGLVIGIPAAFGFQRLLRATIIGVGRNDPASFFSVAILLAAILLIASWIPARRAARVDPIEALRCD